MTSHDTSQSGSSAAEVPTVSFSHSKPDDQVDYDQLNAAGAPGTDELHPPFTPPPAHLAPTDPPSPRPTSKRSSRRGGGPQRRTSSRTPRRRH
ncbi:MAG: hypothetical protein GEV04_23220 [Actinophytocola sp.]|nr:hypothetical protein [Actinophytocola sp.]